MHQDQDLTKGELPLSSVSQASAPLLSLSSQNNGAEVRGRGSEGFWQPDLLLNRVTVGKRARHRSQAALSGRGQKAYTQLQQHQLHHRRHGLMHASVQEDLLSLTARSPGVSKRFRGVISARGSSYPCCCLHVPQERRLDSALLQLWTPPEIKAKRGGVSAGGEEAEATLGLTFTGWTPRMRLLHTVSASVP